MTFIYLARHGRTAWTGKRLIGSTPGVPLDTYGITQAEKLSGFLEQFPIRAIFSGPCERTI